MRASVYFTLTCVTQNNLNHYEQLLRATNFTKMIDTEQARMRCDLQMGLLAIKLLKAY